MGSDSRFAGFSSSVNGFEYGDQASFPDSSQYPGVANVLKFNDPSLDLDFNFVESPLVLPDTHPVNYAVSAVISRDVDSPSYDNEFSETVLKYISQILMEEDMEAKPCMFHDPLAVQAVEKSLYDVIGKKYPPSPENSHSYGDQFLVDSPDDGFSSCYSDYGSNCSSNSCSNAGNSVDPQLNGEFGEIKSSFMQTPFLGNFVFQSTAKSSSSKSPSKLQNEFANDDNCVVGSSVEKMVVPDFFSDSELALQFKRGVEEAKKFLPKGNQLFIDLEASAMIPELKGNDQNVIVNTEKEEREYFSNSFRGKKNHEREDEDFKEERSNKQLAINADEIELSEMFDKLIICTDKLCRSSECMADEALQNGTSKTLQQNEQTYGSNGGRARTKRKGNKKEVVDLGTLLILCAQAISSNDHRTANELLKQIRQHSSPFGDGSQRVAHYFANGLEARLAGTGTQIYSALTSEKTSAADMLKAYQAYISTCPFKKMAIIFANHNILKAAEKATTLHIIDFGILYGFQWPPLIYHLAQRFGGPPKLRITGIELPQSGFRPVERVEETGRRLAKYCERYDVPFEYNAIAQKWETIQIDDLKINPGEFLAVNCLFRFRNLLDETVVVNSPRSAVLNLIRKANPDIFAHAVVNGSYNAPFFVTRFREALFHFSALFDMCDTNMSREDQMRLKFEKEFYGREAMNVIACEGSERVERPETYKQWQVRNVRAGFRQLPLNPQIVQKLKWKVKAGYHNDFVIDEDGRWMVQGWKGRIVYASSLWVPV